MIIFKLNRARFQAIAYERKGGKSITKGGEGREKWEDEIYLRAEVKAMSSRGRQVGG